MGLLRPERNATKYCKNGKIREVIYSVAPLTPYMQHSSDSGMGDLVTIEGIDGAGKTTLIENIEEQYSNADIHVTTEPDDTPQADGEFGNAVRTAISDDGTPPMAVFFLFLADHANHLETRLRPALDTHDLVICDRYIDSRFAYQAHALDDVVADSDDFVAEMETQLSESTYPKASFTEAASDAPPAALFFAFLARLVNGGDEGIHPFLQSGDCEVDLRESLEGHTLAGAAANPHEWLSSIQDHEESLDWIRHVQEYNDWSTFPDLTLFIDIPVEVSFERKDGDAKEKFENREFLTAVRDNYHELADTYTERYEVIDGEQDPSMVSESCFEPINSRLDL